MANNTHERRKYERYATDAKIYFYVTYDINTNVTFQIVDKQKGTVLPERYRAVSKNVNVEGLCFISEKVVNKGDVLYLEVFLPGEKKPIAMEGEVRWSQHNPAHAPHDSTHISTGVLLSVVNGRAVADTIYYDEENKIVWSIVLETVFGNFSKLMRQRQKDSKGAGP